jgi:hypothetical protein
MPGYITTFLTAFLLMFNVLNASAQGFMTGTGTEIHRTLDNTTLDRSLNTTLDRSLNTTLDRSLNTTLDRSLNTTLDRSLDTTLNRSLSLGGTVSPVLR